MIEQKNGLRVVSETPPKQQELRSFLFVLYRALRMICSYLEDDYGFGADIKAMRDAQRNKRSG